MVRPFGTLHRILLEGVKAGDPNIVIVEAAGLYSCPPSLVIVLSSLEGIFVVQMSLCLLPPPLPSTCYKRSEESTDEPRGDIGPPGQEGMMDNEVKGLQIAHAA